MINPAYEIAQQVTGGTKRVKVSKSVYDILNAGGHVTVEHFMKLGVKKMFIMSIPLEIDPTETNFKVES
jgi:hypothetical protein